MTEKKLREIVKPLVDDWTDARFYHDQFQEALAEEPDVVTSLQYIETILKSAREVLRAALRDRATVDEGYACAAERVRVLRKLKAWWQKQFHVCLTETGWEWTE